MASSRVMRLGASVLLSLVLSSGLSSPAFGASPTDPTPRPSASAGVAGVPITPTGATKSKVARAPGLAEAVPAVTGYSIQGIVTAAVGGAHLSDIYVEVDSTTSFNYYTATTAASDGSYWVNGLPADNYVVWFGDPTGTHFNGFYNGGGVPVAYTSAVSVTVTTGSVTGINAQLAVIGPWAISIQASPTSLATGSQVTVTSTTNYDMSLTNFDVFILKADDTGWFCESGTTCYVDDARNTAGTVTYHAIVALPNGSSIQVTSSTVTVTWTGEPLRGATYHALTPTRILDTRFGTGLSGAFSSHVARTFQVTGGITGVPPTATAVTGNLTVTQQTSAGFLYLGPIAADNPTSSTLNFPLGDDRANAVTVALGAGATLSATYAASTLGPSAQVIFDVTGYFTPDIAGATYHSLSPTRILDTRSGIGLSGQFGSHVARTFSATGGVVPFNATAVTGNLTVTQQSSAGFLYLGPIAMNNPSSSTLNFPMGDDRANAVTVALAAGGTLSVTYAAPTLGQRAQVIFDVTGYFTPDMSGATYFPLNPTRVLDTRSGIGLRGVFGSHVARTFWATGRAIGIPIYAAAVTGNLTVTQQTSAGFLYLGPFAMDNPTSSTLNFPMNDDRANAVTVALGAGDLAATYAAPTYGHTAQVIFDATGFFAP